MNMLGSMTVTQSRWHTDGGGRQADGCEAAPWRSDRYRTDWRGRAVFWNLESRRVSHKMVFGHVDFSRTGFAVGTDLLHSFWVFCLFVIFMFYQIWLVLFSSIVCIVYILSVAIFFYEQIAWKVVPYVCLLSVMHILSNVINGTYTFILLNCFPIFQVKFSHWGRPNMRPEGLVISPHEGDSPWWTEMGSHVISPRDEKVPCGFLGNTSRHTGVGEEDGRYFSDVTRQVSGSI